MKKTTVFFALVLVLTILFSSCQKNQGGNTPDGNNGNTSVDPEATAKVVETEKTEIPEGLTENENTLKIKCEEGTNKCWKFEGQTLTFSGLSEDTICSISGNFNGAIVIDVTDSYKFELELDGVQLFTGKTSPITILSGDKVTISAKKDSKNYIYDTRAAVSSEDETSYAAAVYSKSDLDIQGKGEVTVISSHNNGIHTKDSLEIKNVTLSVTCVDNALKGNDKVEISSGSITLISKSGDGIKTTNTDISEKGNQRGKVIIGGGNVTIYAACDGIDAAYDVDVSGDAVLNIYTDKYSPYSESVESVSGENVRYVRFTSQSYNFSIKYYNSDTDYKMVNATFYKSVSGGRTTYYYYSFDKLEGYSKVQLFIYTSSQTQGSETEYKIKSDFLTWNTAYDTLALDNRYGGLSYNWANYSTTVSDGRGGTGGMGGPGGMNDGNSEKSEYSTKGIKAGNEVHISGGTIEIKAYDDAIHANNESTLENGAKATGNVLISGGTMTLFSKDDGIHGDANVTISGGKINITGCYEGVEGYTINITGGETYVVSSDDGFNSTSTSDVGMTFDGGYVNIYAGGDGIDSNSRTSYQGFVFNGGTVIVVSNTSMNSSLDTESGYAYNGGIVLAMCPANGMTSETTKCKNFSSIATKTTKSLTQGQKVTVTVDGTETVSMEMPCKLSASVIYLGSKNAKIS